MAVVDNKKMSQEPYSLAVEIVVDAISQMVIANSLGVGSASSSCMT